jgi:hypothetical protein
MPDAAATFDWGAWEPFDARLGAPLREVTREDAEDYFARLMAARAERIAALEALARRHQTPLDVGVVSAWLARSLRQAGPTAIKDPMWSGLVADVSLWLGEQLIARSGTLRWELFTTHKKATGYQRPVLTGFSKVADRHYYVDIAFMVASWAELAARGRAVQDDFLATIFDVTLRDA